MSDEAVLRIVVQDEGGIKDDAAPPERVPPPTANTSTIPPPNRASQSTPPPQSAAARPQTAKQFDPIAEAQGRREAEIRREQINLAYDHLYESSEKTNKTFDAIMNIATKLRGTLGGAFGPLVGSLLDVFAAVRDARKDMNVDVRAEAERRNAQQFVQPEETKHPPVTATERVQAAQQPTASPNAQTTKPEDVAAPAESHASNASVQQSKTVLDEAAAALRAVGHTQVEADHLLRTLLQSTTRTFGTVQEVLQAIYSRGPNKVEEPPAKHMQRGGIVPSSPGVLSTEDEVPISAQEKEFVVQRQAATNPANLKILEAMNRGESVEDHYVTGGDVKNPQEPYRQGSGKGTLYQTRKGKGEPSSEVSDAGYDKRIAMLERVYGEKRNGWRDGFASEKEDAFNALSKIAYDVVRSDKDNDKELGPMWNEEHKFFSLWSGENTELSIYPGKRKGVYGYKVQGIDNTFVPENASDEAMAFAVHRSMRMKSPTFLKNSLQQQKGESDQSNHKATGGEVLRKFSTELHRDEDTDAIMGGRVSLMDEILPGMGDEEVGYADFQTDDLARRHVQKAIPDMDQSAMVMRMSGIELNPLMQGKGVGAEMYLRAMNAVPGRPYFYNSQISEAGMKSVQGLADKGHIELHRMNPHDPQQHVKRITEAGQKFLTAKDGESLATGGEVPHYVDAGPIQPDATHEVRKDQTHLSAWDKTKSLASNVISAPGKIKDFANKRYGKAAFASSLALGSAATWAATPVIAPMMMGLTGQPFLPTGTGMLTGIAAAEVRHRLKSKETIARERAEEAARDEAERGVLGQFKELPAFAESGAGHYVKGGNIHKSLTLDEESSKTLGETGDATAFRVHDAKYKLPEKSKSSWHGDDETHMPGVSGYANLINAIDDLLFDADLGAGGNYASQAKNPSIVAMMGRSIDGPDAEVIVPNPKIAAVFTKEEVESAYRKVLKRSIEGDPSTSHESHVADTDSISDLKENWRLSSGEREEIADELLNNFKEKKSGQGYVDPRIHKATGGPVQTFPGIPSAADEVPIRATAKEFIVNRVASQDPDNREVLEMMNKGFHYAAGGELTPDGPKPARADSLLGRERQAAPHNDKGGLWALEATQREVLAAINKNWQPSMPASSPGDPAKQPSSSDEGQQEESSSPFDRIMNVASRFGGKNAREAYKAVREASSFAKPLAETTVEPIPSVVAAPEGSVSSSTVIAKAVPEVTAVPAAGMMEGIAGVAELAAGPVGVSIAVAKAVEVAIKGARDSMMAGVKKMGDVAGVAVDPDVNPAKMVGNIGEGTKQVSDTLLFRLHPALGVFGSVVGEATSSMGKLMDAVNATANRYGEYNVNIASAQAMAEVQHVMGDLRRAQEAGPELARYVQMQGDLQQKFEDIKIKVLLKILPIVTAIGEVMEKLLPNAELIGPAIDALGGPLLTLAQASASIVNLMSDANRPVIDDPTTMLFQDEGPLAGQGVGVPRE